MNYEPRTDLQVGQLVTATRIAEDGEGGWDNTWALDMDNAVGRIGRITANRGASGLDVRFPAVGLTYRYPHFVLEPVSAGPVSDEAWAAMRSGS